MVVKPGLLAVPWPVTVCFPDHGVFSVAYLLSLDFAVIH